MPLPSWIRRPRLDEDDLQDEIRAHLAIAADERVADGANRQAAQRASLKDFGNVTLLREEVHIVWTPRWLDALRDQIADARYALRVLAKSPAFSITVILVLTLGIGLNAAVFTLLKGLALNPLAGVADSSRLGVIVGKTSTGRLLGLSYPDYQYVRDHDQAFTSLSASAFMFTSLGRGRQVNRAMTELVSGNYFESLGVRAQLGRTLLPTDEVAPGRHPVAVISDGLWRRTFGGDPDILGTTVVVNGYPLTVVGVADPSFHGTVVSFDIEVFAPIMMAPQIGIGQEATSADILSNRRASFLMVMGHPRPGVTLKAAAAQTAVLSAQLATEHEITDVAQRLEAIPIWESPFGAQTYLLPAVIVLSVMGLLLLLLVCANIAGLVLVRGVSRRGEIALRQALGASRPRILRLLFVENFALAIPGALAGVVLTWQVLPLLWTATPVAGAPGRLFMNLAVDRLVISFSMLAAFCSAMVFGFVPALRTSRVDLLSVLKDDLSARGAARGRLRAGLVVAQIAVSLLLLVGSGLVTRSLERSRQAYPGFNAAQVISMALDPKANGYDDDRGRTMYVQLLDALASDPAIESATLAAYHPMSMVDFGVQRMAIQGYEPRKDEDVRFLSNTVGPSYFQTLRIPIVTGREFVRQDDDRGAPVAIVNVTLARRFWGGEADALGKRIRVGSGDWRTVVGVAQDVKYSRINESPRPYAYVPWLQAYQSVMYVHARGPASTPALLTLTRQHLAALDPDLTPVEAMSLGDRTVGSMAVLQITSRMLFIFGLAGMVLAGLGIYGLVSYSVKQSTHEIGIRMALGAQRLAVVRHFLGRGLQLGLLGAGIGIVGALAATRLLSSVLFGVTATDATAFAGALGVVLIGVAVATVLPASRAARTNPLTALRHQ